MNTLTGKTALVTGASRGIGRATALALAQAGAQFIGELSAYSATKAAVDTLVRHLAAISSLLLGYTFVGLGAISSVALPRNGTSRLP